MLLMLAAPISVIGTRSLYQHQEKLRYSGSVSIEYLNFDIHYTGLKMALLDEQLVEEWLNRKKFFTIRGIKCGIDEIDLLAVKHDADTNECWHVEVQVSFRPIGYVGGDTNARKRSTEEIRAGIEQWVDKKFTSQRKVTRRNEFFPNAQWRYVFVHGVLRDESELDFMRELGVDSISYKQVLTELRYDSATQSSSIASNIADLLRYME